MNLKLKKKINSRRKADYYKFFSALFITLIIFLSSFLLGIYFDNTRYKVVKSIVEKQDLEFEMLQVQYLFLQQVEGEKNKNFSCSVTSTILENNVKTLSPILNKILDYEKNKNTNLQEYTNLRIRYDIYNTKYFLLAEKSRKECNNDIVTILYFFNNKCESCKKQGYILSGLKKVLKEKILVYPFEEKFKSEDFTVDLLVKSYNITTTPTIIVNEKTRIEGFVDKEKLKSIICKEYKKKPSICKYDFSDEKSILEQ